MQFRYRQIERALARAHDIPLDPESMKTFRGRVRNLQKIGLVPSAPGKGKSISYSTRDAMFWAACFEFTQAGLAPSTTKEIMETNGKKIVLVCTTVSVDKNLNIDKFILIKGEFLKWHLLGTTEKELAGSALRIKTLQYFLDEGLPPRSILINLSAMSRRMGDALSAEVTIEDFDAEEPGTITPARGF